MPTTKTCTQTSGHRQRSQVLHHLTVDLTLPVRLLDRWGPEQVGGVSATQPMDDAHSRRPLAAAGIAAPSRPCSGGFRAARVTQGAMVSYTTGDRTATCADEVERDNVSGRCPQPGSWTGTRCRPVSWLMAVRSERQETSQGRLGYRWRAKSGCRPLRCPGRFAGRERPHPRSWEGLHLSGW